MKRGYKFVAIILVLFFLGGSLSALGCQRPGTSMAGHCAPNCPMMNARFTDTAVQAKVEGISCCNISSGKPEPASVLLAPAASAPLVLVPQIVDLLAQTVVIPAVGARDSVPIAAGPPPQALLCIFLI